jgi:hypothetical protein
MKQYQVLWCHQTKKGKRDRLRNAQGTCKAHCITYNVSVAVRGHSHLFPVTRQVNTSTNMSMNNLSGNKVLPCVVNYSVKWR